jgi:hypothetical protein
MSYFSYSSRAQIALTALLGTAVFLTACSGGGETIGSVHESDSGLMLEDFIPMDVDVVFSYSLLEDEQYANVQAIEAALIEDTTLTDLIAESFNEEFADTGLDLETDLIPAFGDQFRMMLGMSVESEMIYLGATLSDPERMELVLTTLVEAGTLDEKRLSGANVYVGVDEDFYATVHDDLLLISSDVTAIENMTDLEETLSDNEFYQDALKEVGDAHVAYGMIFQEAIMANSEELDASVFGLYSELGMTDVTASTAYQVYMMAAAPNGLEFELVVQANEEKADENGVRFDHVPVVESSLYEVIPAEGMMGYAEGYGLQQTLDQAMLLEEDSEVLLAVSEFFTNYFAMDFETEILSFMDQGMAMSIHAEEGNVFPGLTFMFDASNDLENAENFVAQMHGQLSAYATLFGAELGEALQVRTLETHTGDELHLIHFDFAAIPQEEGVPTGIPTEIENATLQLAYGMMGDNLIISMADIWGEDMESIADSAFYATLNAELPEGAGLGLMDVGGIISYIETLEGLRGDLGLGDSEATDVIEFLDGFYGFIGKSEYEQYRAESHGFLMIK